MSYKEVINTLRVMDDRQLEEMFYDIVEEAGIDYIENLADVAYHFVENYEDERTSELSQDEDALEVDNARRARELK